MYVDSHAHFDTFVEEGTIDDVLKRNAEVGVDSCIAIGGSDKANACAASLSVSYPGRIYATVGYDRDEAGKSHDMGAMEALLGQDGVVGVGETGLDYHYNADTSDAQKALFKKMLDAAAASRKPVVVHSRDADDDMIEMLSSYCASWEGDAAPGVLHCFTGGSVFCERLLALGMMISFSGIITFKNAGDLREVVREVPNERLLIETDAPYLAPVPFRGKQNEPGFVIHVAQVVADLRGVAVEEIARITAENTKRLFGIAKEST